MENTIEYSLGNNPSYSVRYICTQNIMVVKADASNQIIWNVFIDKNQYICLVEKDVISMIPIRFPIQKYLDLSSFVCIFTEKGLHFIFNDDISSLGDCYKGNADSESYCSAVSLNLEDGEWEKKSLFSNQESKTYISPGNSKQISNAETITFSFKDGKCRIGKIRIDP